jgi:transcriptional regulator with XRE-family HTH domain
MTRRTDPTIARAIGANIRRAREAAGLSQEDLGFRANLHRTAVGNLEVGAQLPRADTVIQIAGALGVAPGELLDGISWQPLEIASGGFRLDSPDHDGLDEDGER